MSKMSNGWGEQDWRALDYVDDDGTWRSEKQWFQWGNDAPQEEGDGVAAVNKGTGKGTGPS